jgi:hypothetical protein
MARSIVVTLKADTREVRRQMIRAELLFARSWLRRQRLRLELWRINREEAP